MKKKFLKIVSVRIDPASLKIVFFASECTIMILYRCFWAKNTAFVFGQKGKNIFYYQINKNIGNNSFKLKISFFPVWIFFLLSDFIIEKLICWQFKWYKINGNLFFYCLHYYISADFSSSSSWVSMESKSHFIAKDMSYFKY